MKIFDPPFLPRKKAQTRFAQSDRVLFPQSFPKIHKNNFSQKKVKKSVKKWYGFFGEILCFVVKTVIKSDDFYDFGRKYALSPSETPKSGRFFGFRVLGGSIGFTPKTRTSAVPSPTRCNQSARLPPHRFVLSRFSIFWTFGDFLVIFPHMYAFGHISFRTHSLMKVISPIKPLSGKKGVPSRQGRLPGEGQKWGVFQTARRRAKAGFQSQILNEIFFYGSPGAQTPPVVYKKTQLSATGRIVTI